MTSESAILRAYALLMQGRHDEAEATLRNAQGALDTPSGADLLARIRFEQGLEDDARRIWLRIHEVFPDFEPAAKAIDAFQNPPPIETDTDSDPSRLSSRLRMAVVAAVIIGVMASTIASIKGCRSEKETVQSSPIVVTNYIDRVETKIVERCTTNFVDRVQKEYTDKIVTNVVERTVEVPSSITITNTVENIVWITNVVTVAVNGSIDSTTVEEVQDVATEGDQHNETANSQSFGKYVFETPYTVKEGDTVSKLSALYRFRIPDFKACNPELDIDHIRVGQIIMFPGDIKIGDSP